MTLRPHIIRADTLDLQDHETPSAGDHTHQPEHPGPLGAGPAAPHHETALRHANQDRHAEQDLLADAWGSGRSSHEGSDLLHDDISNAADETRLDDDAMLQNGTAASASADAERDDRLDDDIMDDRSSSPSIEEEEIDYDFVYALHNFVATVEGQANATKGDHMVLLDDTNSYWWLVRVVKDSSIGYLPAEHIETPNERLARLYKHRNIQSTQSILDDFQPKSRNPLKIAMRRRNAKTVQFTAPTFYEPEEVDWSDVEGDSDREEESLANDAAGAKQTSQQNDDEELAEADGSQPNGETVETPDVSNDDENSRSVASDVTRTALDSSRAEPDMLEQQETTPSRSRNGTMRNTDSFFKDNTAEPKKMTLTPNILRDESGDTPTRSAGGSTEKPPSAQEVFEQMDNGGIPSDKNDKKKKDKKSGMLSGLFKRKDRKIKVDEAAGGVAVKQEVDSGSPILTPGDSGTGSPTGSYSPSATSSQLPPTQRPGSSGKLTRAPPAPLNTPPNEAAVSPITALQAPPVIAQPEQVIPAPDERSVAADSSMATEEGDTAEPKPLSIDTSVSSRTRAEEIKSKSLFSSNSDAKREKLKKAKQRIDLDVESSPEEPPDTNGLLSGSSREVEADNENEDQYMPVSPIDASEEETTSRPNLALDTSSQQHETDSPPTPFDTTDAQDIAEEPRQAPSAASSAHSVATAAESLSTPSPSSSPVSAATPPAAESADHSWNDGALRSYLDERSSADIKDMLIRVHDKTGVVPLPLNHPKMLGLGYHESQKRLDEMSSQLDGLLNGFLARSAARPKNPQK